jgi:hypothetical protein
MAALFCRLLGRVVWAVVIGYLRRKHGRLLLPRGVLGGGAATLAVAAALERVRRARRS